MHSHQFTDKPVISHIVMMGDSLSDRGTLDHRYLLKVIPMAWLAGLSGRSPQGRFTNGYAWSDHISAKLADEFLINSTEHHPVAGEHKKEFIDSTDLADSIITGAQSHLHAARQPLLDATDVSDDVISDHHFEQKLQNSYTMDNNLYVQYHGRDFVRNYDEGGLTSHDYSWKPSTSISRFFSRLILSTLKKKREALLEHDHQLEVSNEQKKQTLLIEWSGANDLVTVNAKPSKAEADMAIRDRIANTEKLIHQGYRHVVLFNMPDLSLCPRFQNMKGPEGARAQQNGKEVVAYFNAELKKASDNLQEKYKGHGCSVEVYDVNQLFTAVYNDALNQTHHFPCHFEKDKLHTPYIQSKDFVDKKGLSPASGYMFWDDVHPSADMHAVLAENFYQQATKTFQFAAPKVETPRRLCDAFIKKFNELYSRDMLGHFGFFRNSSLPLLDYSKPEQAIVAILKHALEDNGERTRKAITDLQWIDAKGKINVKIPALKEAEMLYTARLQRKAP